MQKSEQKYKWFVSGDINGFFGLMFDNLTVLSFLAGILIFVFKFPADIIYTRMFPGTAFGVLFGDLVYTWMAFRLAKKANNPNVTAMPLGLDTPSTIGLTLVVLGPAFVGLKAEGFPERDAAMMTWYIGMATMMFMGIVKLIFSFLGQWVQKIVPQAGLLGSLAGIGLGLIGITPLFDIFGMPLVGLIALGMVFYTLVAGIRLPGKIPGVFASVAIGTALYYILGPAGLVGGTYSGAPPLDLHFGLPIPTLDFIKGLGPALKYLPLAIPFGILTVVGGINVTESARVAGDNYNTRNILLTEAFATLLAGLCGGVAQSTPYIGQPAYKNMGSRAGYTLLTGIFVGLGGILGYVSFIVEFIPRAVLAPILIFVAFDIIMQSFHAVPARHAPAVAFAFFPTIARLLAIKLGNPEAVPMENFSKLMVAPGKSLPELQVIVALGNGFIVTAMLWAAFLAELIDRKLKRSAVYLLVLAGLTFFGVIHSAMPDGAMYLPWTLAEPFRQIPNQFTLAYIALAILFLVLSFTKESKEPITGMQH
jgi:AGZA family xanthine/uracil permease-like MFS transporter